MRLLSSSPSDTRAVLKVSGEQIAVERKRMKSCVSWSVGRICSEERSVKKGEYGRELRQNDSSVPRERKSV